MEGQLQWEYIYIYIYIQEESRVKKFGDFPSFGRNPPQKQKNRLWSNPRLPDSYFADGARKAEEELHKTNTVWIVAYACLLWLLNASTETCSIKGAFSMYRQSVCYMLQHNRKRDYY